MADRFDFENMIMQCWNVTDDIKTISKFVDAYQNNMSLEQQDKLMNMLNGVEALYHEKFTQLMDMFSTMVSEKIIMSDSF